mmetsp:Transcript_1585/g.6928  ORF Transcript_1585/g.6928 Transcript_1585/m.6928 type:complete len:352 (-) Transcript_1585:713-1768(-)
MSRDDVSQGKQAACLVPFEDRQRALPGRHGVEVPAVFRQIRVGNEAQRIPTPGALHKDQAARFVTLEDGHANGLHGCDVDVLPAWRCAHAARPVEPFDGASILNIAVTHRLQMLQQAGPRVDGERRHLPSAMRVGRGVKVQAIRRHTKRRDVQCGLDRVAATVQVSVGDFPNNPMGGISHRVDLDCPLLPIAAGASNVKVVRVRAERGNAIDEVAFGKMRGLIAVPEPLHARQRRRVASEVTQRARWIARFVQRLAAHTTVRPEARVICTGVGTRLLLTRRAKLGRPEAAHGARQAGGGRARADGVPLPVEATQRTRNAFPRRWVRGVAGGLTGPRRISAVIPGRATVRVA